MKNSVVKMKSNPAKNEVLEACEDNVLSNYLREISDYRQLSAEEERELAKRADEGDAHAKNKLIQAHLKLVITIAKKAIHTSNLPMIDLIQEGNLGLMVAADKFNYKLGYKFATYASWWIKQAMFKAISEQGHCMKIPVYIQETLSKFSKIKREMEREANGQVNTRDVAKKMDIAPDKIDMFLSAYSKTISIENGLQNADGREMSVADIIEDERAGVNENIERESLKQDIQMVVSTLKEREREVVRLRFGLDDAVKHTLEEIGNIYGVTKECIRQTEMRALKKLRAQEVLSVYVN
ncbi:MAG: sigma-70 family RNA polymerase sigma factor [Heliobacteriaceae bacterium]|jgi:RNA polymerase primary sigma factor|nr:sigma-70 family RNA polymerase sigma factor [Heliobacteriaceae bacterium]